MTIDATVIAVRNQLPGRDAATWAGQIRDLGQLLARNVITVRFGACPEGPLTPDDLVYYGMTEEVALALIPALNPREGYRRLWRHLENLRAAANALAAPEITAALDVPKLVAPRHYRALGKLTPLFDDDFLTLGDVRKNEPRIDILFEDRMVALRGQEAIIDALEELERQGWFRLNLGKRPEHVLLNNAIGVLVVATDASTEVSLNRTLDDLLKLGAPILDRVLAGGGQPVVVARGLWDDGEMRWALDGEPLRSGLPLARGLPKPPPLLLDQVRSLVGQIHSRIEGIALPDWAKCDSCGSTRVEAARLEVDRGVSTFQLDASNGVFPSNDGKSHLVLSGRKAQKSSLVACVLRCPDCYATRPFPGEEMLRANSLPRRMAGERLPRGLRACLTTLTGQSDAIPETAVPEGIDEWMRTQKFGATTQFSDLRLTWRTSFRLPDNLADLARSMPEGAGAERAWRDAAGRLGRSKERVLAWELRDLGNPALEARRIVVIAVDPEHAAMVAERWFGPVDDWVAVTNETCWRGTLVGSGGRTEMVLIQDFLGAPGPFAGGEADYEFLTGLVRQAACVIYAGDGLLEWDDDGIQWAADEGRLVAVVAPAQQLALATPPDGEIAWIDANAPNSDHQLFDAVDKQVDPAIKAILKRMRETIAALDQMLPRDEMADHMLSDHLRGLAVQAELTGRPEAWFYLFDGILDTLAVEGIGGASERRMVRASVAARRLAELGLDPQVSDAWWHLIEFHERMGVGKRMTRWLQPILREHPDPVLLGRIRAVGVRMPDLVQRYTELRELRMEMHKGRKVSVRRAVLEFWLGASAPFLWRAGHTSLPDLLSQAPSHMRGKATVFIGGPSLRSGLRLATLWTGFGAVGAERVPDPGVSTPTIVLQPKKVDLLRLEQRTTAGNVTVIVDVADPRGWEEALPCAGVLLTPELSVPTPPEPVMARRLPPMDPEDLRDLTSLMHTITLEPGAHVIEPNTYVGGCAWIRKGSVVVDSDTLLSTNALIAGDALFFSGRYPHEVVAVEKVVLDVLSLSGFLALETAGRMAVTAVEYATARSVSSILGAGTLEASWRPRRDRWSEFAGDWSLYWPLAQRNGWDGVEPEHLIKAFPSAQAVTLTQGVLYEPGAEPDYAFIVLDGEVLVDDGVRQMQHGPGHYLGRLGLRPPDVPWGERASALRPVTLLVLGADMGPIWEAPQRAFRLALIRTLRERWAMTPRAS